MTGPRAAAPPGRHGAAALPAEDSPAAAASRAAAVRSAAAARRGAGDMMVSDADKQRIAAAIHEAERKTSGEIFCVIARRASDYRLFPFTLAAGLSLIVPLPLILGSNWPASAIYSAQLVVFILLNF